ncbi:MAG TPA: ATP-binding protein, partial [Minicystis sp.]|nr:ATP-binding protein [Minicystis sp.]
YVARRASHPELGVATLRLALALTEVDHAIASARHAVAVGTLAALALAAALLGFGAHLFTAPVRRVTDAALRMASGELAARAPARGEDEVAQLGRALTGLAAQLSRSIDELRGERDVLSGILDGMGEGVLLCDDELRVVLANRALRQIARLGDDAVGKGAIELLRSASVHEALEAARAGGEPVTREVELGPVLTRRLLVRVSRVPQPDGQAILAVFHDVTDLRRLETIRTDFVANVSHELRTPVTAISTAVETLLAGALEDAADAREFAEVIDRHSKRLRQLVDDLLDLAKIEAKGFRLALRDVDLAPVVEQAARTLEPAARARRVDVAVDLGPRALRVHADPRALEQVISNLLDNAIKYGGEGATVRVAAREDAGLVEVTVRDDGPGIPTAHLNRIFERFYRVDPGRSRELGGTGLGLSIVKHLTELMQGSVEVESEPGAGATFRVTVPATGTADGPPAQGSRAAAGRATP